MAGAKSPSYYQPHEVRTEEYRIARPMAAANDRVGCVGGQVIGLVLYPRVLLDRCACRSAASHIHQAERMIGLR
jgi:hypothetical protein